MAKKVILTIDDEEHILDLLEYNLEKGGYDVLRAETGEKGLAVMKTMQVDLVLLDYMLPGIDGIEVLKTMRADPALVSMPVIMLTAREQEIDKITGLTLGADDYVTKPFRPLELVARVKAQLRRSTQYNRSGAEENETIAISGLVLNRENHECFLNEKPLTLTPTEFSILWVLCQNRGRVVSTEELFRTVWGEKYFTSSSNTVMVHIRHLREKLGDSADRPRYIKTVWGVGYKVEK